MAEELSKEKKYSVADRNGNRPISAAEIEKLLDQVNMAYAVEFILRDLDAGIPYVGASFRIINPAAEEEKK